MRITGLDLSLTATGLATRLGPDMVPAVRRLTPRTCGHEREAYLLAQIAVECEGCDLAVIEGVFAGGLGSIGTVMDLAGLQHLVRHLLWQMGVPYAVIPPQSLKAFATGNASADKVRMAVAAARRFGESVPVRDSDTADALWAMAAGCQYAGEPAVTLPAAQVAYLSAVHTEKAKRGRPKIAWPEVLGNAAARQEPSALFPLSATHLG